MCRIAKTVAAVHAGVFLGGCASRWWALCLCCCRASHQRGTFYPPGIGWSGETEHAVKKPLGFHHVLVWRGWAIVQHIISLPQYHNIKIFFCSRLKQTTSATLATSSTTTTTKTLLSAVRWVQAFMHGRRRSKPHPKKNHYQLRTSGRRPGFNLWETFFFAGTF